jgi:hypothetical protein
MSVFFYKFTKNLILVFSSFLKFKSRPVESNSFETVLLIVAGQGGWQSIDIDQLHKSSQEFIGDHKVIKLQTNQEKSYISQVKKFLISNPKITHILHDPRSGRPEYKQTVFNMYWDGLRLVLLLRRLRIIPIVYLTDAQFKLWRMQASIVTIFSGVVITFISSRKIKNKLPHSRFIGPSVMPISIQTLESLIKIKGDLTRSNQIENLVRFSGSYYEPRTTFLNSLKEKLGDDLSIIARPIGSTRVPENEYWSRLASATINITTADQMEQIGTDNPSEKHLVYRYLEVLAVGSLLIAPRVSGITRYLTPGVDFVDFLDLNDAYSKAIYYLSHKQDREKITKSGFDVAQRLIRNKVFWLQIDCALGTESLT